MRSNYLQLSPTSDFNTTLGLLIVSKAFRTYLEEMLFRKHFLNWKNKRINNYNNNNKKTVKSAFPLYSLLKKKYYCFFHG